MVKKGSDKKNMKKNGFTLMELVVYMAIVGIVVLIAGQAFSDSTKFRVRSQNILKAQQIAGNLKAAISFDIYNTGAKSSKETQGAADKDEFKIADLEKIYINPKTTSNNCDAATDAAQKCDSSSFVITPGATDDANTESLEIRRVRYNDDGTYAAIEKVVWFLDGTILKRSCRTIDGNAAAEVCPKEGETSANTPESVEMAENVTEFKVRAATPSVKTEDAYLLPNNAPEFNKFTLLPRYGEENYAFVNVSPAVDFTNYVALNGFSANYDFENEKTQEKGQKVNQLYFMSGDEPTSGETSANQKWQKCSKITLEPETEYELSFSMPFSEDASRMFCPGRDHMAVGFRNDNGEKPANLNLEDFLFYPPSSDGPAAGKRAMRFNVTKKVENVCLAFTFASFSPIAATGTVTISDLILKKVESENYSFDNQKINPAEKQFVKALSLKIVVNQKGETGVDSLVVPIPSNGPRD